MNLHSVHFKKISFVKILPIALLFYFFIPTQIQAAEVVVSPETGSYSVGQSFSVIVQVNPQGKSVNVVEATLRFDTTKLSVVDISKTGSVFSLWTDEPIFSNSVGTIDFGGASLTPFSIRSDLVTITFRALEEGSATVSVASASVLVADNLRTDVYTEARNATFAVTTATTQNSDVTPTEDTIDAFDNLPRIPEVTSTTFRDPEVWYATKVGVFTWDVPSDVDVLAFDMSTSSEFEPLTIYKPPINQVSMSEENLLDGIQYLTLQYKRHSEWEGILHRKIMIDTIPPEPFIINVRPGDASLVFPLLIFEATDKTSGIQKYEIRVGGGEDIAVTPDDAKLGYLLTDLEDGTYTVSVVAVDFAGNKTESSVAVRITAGWHSQAEAVAMTFTLGDLFKGKNLLVFLLVLVLIVQSMYLHYVRLQHEQKEQRLRNETREVQDQMEKIFSALRDEIYDQINMITKRKRLSKKEKEAIGGLNQALEVSETLLEKEITDITKILK